MTMIIVIIITTFTIITITITSSIDIRLVLDVACSIGSSFLSREPPSTPPLPAPHPTPPPDERGWSSWLQVAYQLVAACIRYWCNKQRYDTCVFAEEKATMALLALLSSRTAITSTASFTC